MWDRERRESGGGPGDGGGPKIDLTSFVDRVGDQLHLKDKDAASWQDHFERIYGQDSTTAQSAFGLIGQGLHSLQIGANSRESVTAFREGFDAYLANHDSQSTRRMGGERSASYAPHMPPHGIPAPSLEQASVMTNQEWERYFQDVSGGEALTARAIAARIRDGAEFQGLPQDALGRMEIGLKRAFPEPTTISMGRLIPANQDLDRRGRHSDRSDGAEPKTNFEAMKLAWQASWPAFSLIASAAIVKAAGTLSQMASDYLPKLGLEPSWLTSSALTVGAIWGCAKVTSYLLSKSIYHNLEPVRTFNGTMPEVTAWTKPLVIGLVGSEVTLWAANLLAKGAKSAADSPGQLMSYHAGEILLGSALTWLTLRQMEKSLHNSRISNRAEISSSGRRRLGVAERVTDFLEVGVFSVGAASLVSLIGDYPAVVGQQAASYSNWGTVGLTFLVVAGVYGSRKLDDARRPR